MCVISSSAEASCSPLQTLNRDSAYCVPGCMHTVIHGHLQIHAQSSMHNQTYAHRMHTTLHNPSCSYIRSGSRAAGGSIVEAGVTRARPRARACSTGSRQPGRERQTVREQQSQAGGGRDARKEV